MNKSIWLAALVTSAFFSTAQTVVAEDMKGMNHGDEARDQSRR